MKNNPLLLIILFAIMISPLSAETEKNPYLDMVGKTFAEYYYPYHHVFDSIFFIDSLSRVKMKHWFEEAAASDNTGEWEIFNRYVAYDIRFFESRDGGLEWSEEYTAEEYLRDIEALSIDAKKKGFRLISLWILSCVAENNRDFTRNYEHAFSCLLEIASEIENIPTKEFPIRPYIYGTLANLYYAFKEYDESIIYLQKIIDDPDSKENYSSDQFNAMNTLGLCYRNAYQDYDRSDVYFRMIYDHLTANSPGINAWEGISAGNIGYNYLLRGELDTALSWLNLSIELIDGFREFVYAASRLIRIADIYIKKNKPEQAKKYIDMALASFSKSHQLEKGSIYYDVISRYYILIGDKQATTVYLDSLLLVTKRENENFSGLVLHRIEQQLRAADKKGFEYEVNKQIAEKKSNWNYFLFALSGCILLVLLLGAASYYNRIITRKNYSLYRQINKQRRIDKEKEAEKAELQIPDKQLSREQKLYLKLQQLMLSEKLFTDPEIDRNKLFERLGTNRQYLADALRQEAGLTLGGYLTDLRLKYALELLSDYPELTLDAIAQDSGHGSYSAFFRAFTQRYGMTPSEFRKFSIEKNINPIS